MGHTAPIWSGSPAPLDVSLRPGSGQALRPGSGQALRPGSEQAPGAATRPTLDLSYLTDVVRRADAILNLSLLGVLKALKPRETWPPEPVARFDPLLAAHLGVVLAGDTLVIYTADHGDVCGAHGMVDEHLVMVADVVRVPLVARRPGRIAPGDICDAFVSRSLDLATTFCRVAGAPVPTTFRGRSLVPLFEGAQDNSRQDIFATYHGYQFGLYSQRMVHDRRWKYVWNATAEDELYDLRSDPAELHNLATDPAHAAELARLRRRLVAWMEQTHDPLLNPWTRAQLLEGLKL